MHRRLGLFVLCAVLAGSMSQPPALAQSGSVPLSLDQCLNTALENNLSLVSARKNPAIAEQQIDVSRSAFDGVLSAGVNFNDSDGDEDIVLSDGVAVAEQAGSSESEALTGDVSFTDPLQFGGQYSVTYNLTDVDFSSTSVQAATGFLTQSTFTQENDGFTFNYEMPLLGGLGKEANTVDILLAQGSLDISREDLRRDAISTLQAVEDSYWDTLAAREAVRISKLSLKRAEDLLELNRKKVEVGTLAPIEITEAEAGVASQVESVIVAETTLENAEDVLLQLMAVPDSDPMWGRKLELVDRPSFSPKQLDLDDAIATALARRPEMATARQRLKDNELSERVAKKNSRHGLDLTAALTPGTQDDVDRSTATLFPPGIPPSITTTASDDTDWSVGLRYTYTVRNRRAKASHRIAQLNTEKSDLDLRDLEQTIRVDVRRSVRDVESGNQRVAAARKNVELQQKKLDAENKKFDNGMSTSFEVLTFQNDLANAELSEIRARLDYVKALTAMERAKGTLLEARGLSLGD